MRTTATLAAAVFAAGGALVSAQIGRPQATFRSEINYVEVDVVVTDAQGRFVPGLTAADFELFDAGRPQKIEVVHEVDLPIEHADRPLFASGAIPRDVASNVSVENGRVYLLVLDDLHTTPSNTQIVKQRAREFVDKYLGSNDLAAVLHTSGRREVSQDFTSNRLLLLAAIDGFMGRGLKSALENRMEDFGNIQSRGRAAGVTPQRAADRDQAERRAAVRRTFLTIQDLANYMASLSGRRKALLLFSEGVDLEGDSLPSMESTAVGDGQEMRGAMLQAIAAATRANVHVYPIDAIGMTGSGIQASTASLPRGEEAEAQGLTSQGLSAERRNRQATLRVLAEQTGGIPNVDSNRFDANFARIQRENSTYYLLGFYPTTDRDGKFHKLEVRAKRPGVQVRARAGYHATRPTPSAAATPAAPLGDLLTAAVPAAGLPMSVSLPVFKDNAEQAAVLMAIDMPSDVFRFETESGVSAEDLEIVYQVIDPASKVVVSEAQSVQMRLRQETREMIEARGFRGIFQVKVKPGRYQVRIAASTKNAARRGSVFADLVVPDFFGPALAWSGVALTSESAIDVPTRPADTETSKLIPIMPSAVRTFRPGDRLAVYAEAYDNDRRASHNVDLTVAVRDETGKVVFTSSEVRSSSELGGGRGGYGLRTDIPLEGLPAGSYVLTLTARSSASGNATAARDIPFAIS